LTRLSLLLASTSCVAPKSLAISSLLASLSTATIIVAPADWQTWMAPSLTPPAPNTTHTEPGSTLAVLHTAPQPISAQLCRHRPGVIFTRLSLATNNLREFSRAKGLWLENWVEDAVQ
jgi:hypothetical protein